MPEPVERFEWLKTRVTTQIELVDGKPVCFIDVVTPPEHADTIPDVAIGWSPDWSKFGVYVNGHQVWPPLPAINPDTLDDLAVLLNAATVEVVDDDQE